MLSRASLEIGEKTLDMQTFADRKRGFLQSQIQETVASSVRVNRAERLGTPIRQRHINRSKRYVTRSHKYGAHNTNSTIDQIDRDMSLHGCHVVGVQESYIKGDVTREQQHCVAFASGANGNGQLGVEALGDTDLCGRKQESDRRHALLACWSSRLMARTSI